MKSFVFVLAAIVCVSAYGGKSINVQEDGTINVSCGDGRQINISKQSGIYGEPVVEIQVNGPYAIGKRIQVNANNQVRVSSSASVNQVDVLAQILAGYQGPIDEISYGILLDEVQKAVGQGIISNAILQNLQSLSLGPQIGQNVWRQILGLGLGSSIGQAQGLIGQQQWIGGGQNMAGQGLGLQGLVGQGLGQQGGIGQSQQLVGQAVQNVIGQRQSWGVQGQQGWTGQGQQLSSQAVQNLIGQGQSWSVQGPQGWTGQGQQLVGQAVQNLIGQGQSWGVQGPQGWTGQTQQLVGQAVQNLIGKGRSWDVQGQPGWTGQGLQGLIGQGPQGNPWQRVLGNIWYNPRWCQGLNCAGGILNQGVQNPLLVL